VRIGGSNVNIWGKFALTASMIVMTTQQTLAWVVAPWKVPEIDGPAGISALAALAAVGMIVYNRYKK
jgi:hypothetical protein